MRALLLAALSISALLSGCGNDSCNDLFGSAGSAFDLGFSEVTVRFIEGETLEVAYRQADGTRPAVFTAILRGITPESGLSVDLVENINADQPGTPEVRRGSIVRVANDSQGYDPIEEGTLELEEWSGVGGDASGSFGVRLEDGRSMTGRFCGTVTQVGSG